MIAKTLFLNKKFSIFLFLMLIISIVYMRYFDAPLRNDTAPNGIVSFEFAKDLSVSKAILNSWDDHAKASAGLSLGFDFLFLILYATFIALLIFRINIRLWKGHGYYKIGKVLIYAIFIAAFFDILENVALIKLVLGDFKQIWSSIAYFFATFKFGIILLCILYLFLNWIRLLLLKLNVLQ